jgi:cytochrome P450
MFRAQAAISQVNLRPCFTQNSAQRRMVRRSTSRIVRGMSTIKSPRTSHSRSIEAVCAQLGVPQKDWHLFKRWAGKPLTSQALDQLYAYVDVMIAIRCGNPGSDLLSLLIATGVDGEDLTVDELHAVVAALVSRVR